MLKWLQSEAVAIMFAIQTGLALAVDFGLHLSATQETEVLIFTGAVLSIIVRQSVTPNFKAGG